MQLRPVHLKSHAMRRAELSGEMALADMDRVVSRLAKQIGHLRYQLRWCFDEEGRIVIEGTIAADLPLICQRCMQFFYYPLAVEVKLAVVHSEQAAEQLPECYEPLLIQEETIALAVLLEDEVMAHWPFAPMHVDGASCQVPQTDKQSCKQTQTVSLTKKPFADLKKMMTR